MTPTKKGKLDKKLNLKNKNGLSWVIGKTDQGYSLGGFYLNGELIESPVGKGMFILRNVKTGETNWVLPEIVDILSEREINFKGEKIINGVIFSYTFNALINDNHNAIDFIINWEVSEELKDWEIAITYQQEYNHRWKCHLYPHEEDSSFVHESPLTYVGVPAAFLYRENFKTALLFGINPNSDYLNPMNWTKETSFYFTDQLITPQFRIGGSVFKKDLTYSFPIQIIFSASGSITSSIIDLVRTWIDINNYKVENFFVRTPENAVKLFLKGRRNTSAWNPGKGYRLEFGDPGPGFIYIGEQPLSAYFEYRLYEMTGDELWRQRSIEQIDFVLKAQNNNINSRHYGAFHTAYESGDFNSNDRGNNIGYKPDLNSHIARYILLTWKCLKEREGIDRHDWYNAAIKAIDWVLRQQNPDGGLAQLVEINTGRKSISTVSGRTLPALQDIYSITGNSKYYHFSEQLEKFIINNVENKLHFTGHHPDLPPDEIEEAGIWGIIEYWLNKYEATNKKDYLERAVADALISFLWWCPKQLIWVNNPTQCSSAEQQHFLQYSIYNYQNRKNESLYRLYRYTGDYLFKSLYDRVLQGIFWTQVTSGDLKGGTHERIADPWLKRNDCGECPEFNSLGSVYMGEQSLDLMLQLIEMDEVSL